MKIWYLYTSPDIRLTYFHMDNVIIRQLFNFQAQDFVNGCTVLYPIDLTLELL